ncbi:hypothetical protein GWI34_24835, partial [Actinomadura sp. DSM 109109]|nr:hypothetical protein [Actinomadura lepetitiana]
MSLSSPRAYRTVLDALLAPVPLGAAGRHILIEPGLYPNTGFHSSGDFILTAVGGPGSVTLDGATDATIEVTGKVTLQGLIVRNWSDEGLALEVAEGSVLAEKCEFTTRSDLAVRAASGAQLALRDCQVHDGAVVYSSASGIMEGTSVSGTEGNAVAIRSGSTVTVRSCRIADAGGHGIWITEGSRPLIEQTTISGPESAGIRVDDRADAAIRNCAFRSSGQSSLIVLEKGKAVAEDCLIEDAGADALWVATSGSLTARRIRMEATQRTGVVVERGVAVLEDCEVDGAGTNGLSAIAGADVTVVRGRVAGAGKIGAGLGPAARVLLDGTRISDSGLAGVSVEAGGRLTLRDCTVVDNRGAGVVAGEGAHMDVSGLVSERNQKPDRLDGRPRGGVTVKVTQPAVDDDPKVPEEPAAAEEPVTASPAPGEAVGASADELLAELDAMIGLAAVKREIRKLTNLQKVAEKRRLAGLPPGPRIGRHM